MFGNIFHVCVYVCMSGCEYLLISNTKEKHCQVEKYDKDIYHKLLRMMSCIRKSTDASLTLAVYIKRKNAEIISILSTIKFCYYGTCLFHKYQNVISTHLLYKYQSITSCTDLVTLSTFLLWKSDVSPLKNLIEECYEYI